RVDDARRIGATILALEGGDTELAGLAHDAITVPQHAPVSFDGAQHLVSTAAGEIPQRPGLRDRLARLLDKPPRPQVTDKPADPSPPARHRQADGPLAARKSPTSRRTPRRPQVTDKLAASSWIANDRLTGRLLAGPSETGAERRFQLGRGPLDGRDNDRLHRIGFARPGPAHPRDGVDPPGPHVADLADQNLA